MPLASTRSRTSSAAPISGIGLLVDPDLVRCLEGDRAHRGANRIARATGPAAGRQPGVEDPTGVFSPRWIWKRSERALGARRDGDPRLERELLLEVGRVDVLEGDVVAFDQLDEDLDELGVELFAGDAAQLDDRVVRGHRRAVGVAGGHHVVGVGDGDDPRELRDFLALEAARIAFAVDPLVVGEDDVGDRAVAVQRGDDAGALLRVALDQHPVLVGERHVGLEDAVGEDELADVVQQRGDVDELLFLFREAGAVGDRPRVAGDRRRVAGGHLVPQVERAQQGAQHADLEAGQLLAAHLELPGPLLGLQQGAEQVLEGDEDDAEQGDPGEADLDVDEGDPDGHQGRRELRGKQRDQHRADFLDEGAALQVVGVGADHQEVHRDARRRRRRRRGRRRPSSAVVIPVASMISWKATPTTSGKVDEGQRR